MTHSSGSWPGPASHGHRGGGCHASLGANRGDAPSSSQSVVWFFIANQLTLSWAVRRAGATAFVSTLYTQPLWVRISYIPAWCCSSLGADDTANIPTSSNNGCLIVVTARHTLFDQCYLARRFPLAYFALLFGDFSPPSELLVTRKGPVVRSGTYRGLRKKNEANCCFGRGEWAINLDFQLRRGSAVSRHKKKKKPRKPPQQAGPPNPLFSSPYRPQPPSRTKPATV